MEDEHHLLAEAYASFDAHVQVRFRGLHAMQYKSARTGRGSEARWARGETGPPVKIPYTRLLDSKLREHNSTHYKTPFRTW